MRGDYLCHLRQSGAAATAASSFLSSCRYAMHIFGFADFEAVCNSRRLSGMAELLHSGKAPIKQAKVLSVLQVLQLHSMLGRFKHESCGQGFDWIHSSGTLFKMQDTVTWHMCTRLCWTMTTKAASLRSGHRVTKQLAQHLRKASFSPYWLQLLV